MAKRLTDENNFKKRIFRHNKWIFLSGWDVCAGHAHNLPGIYVIYLDGKLSYVGQSNTPKYRFCQHKFRSYEYYETPWGKFKNMYAKIKYPSKYGVEAMIEKRLIKKLKPVFNKYTYKRKVFCAL
jgi:hypothetical protein